MVEIVIALPDGDEGREHVITGCVLVIERSLTEPVSEGIDTEGRLFTNKSTRSVP